MTPIYLQLANIKADTALKTPIDRAKWTDTQISDCMVEAETYIESCLLRLGFNRAQLMTAPVNPAPIVLQWMLNWCRYVILRDIYSDVAPSEGTGERYEKYKENVEDSLAKLEPDKNGHILMSIIDENGVIISPAGGDNRFMIGSNTLNAARMITMDDSESWKIGRSNSVSDVVGHKREDG